MTVGPRNPTAPSSPDRLPPNTRNRDLTLSAVPELLPEDQDAAAVIERELVAIDQGADPGPLLAYVWPECELRALWGDR